ncbi:hypothetical protein FSOLCH5_006317 [Fusarium solani]
MDDSASSAGSDLPRFAVSAPFQEEEYLIPNHEEQCDFYREKKIKTPQVRRVQAMARRVHVLEGRGVFKEPSPES